MMRVLFMKPLTMKITVGFWIMAIGQTRVMITGKPAGQHWPMSS